MKFRPISFLSVLVCSLSSAADWTRFRGPNGSGIAGDDKPVPTEWSDEKNLKWKTPLPGAGYSSPIVSGDRVFVTCWSGGNGRGGDQSDLKRHLVCIDRATGKILWEKSVAAKLPEGRSQHGYATHTPVTDGRNVYVFFGKSGVFAYDFAGSQLWQADTGSGLDRRSWGSASSPILHDHLLIVTASAESHAMYAFDTASGKPVWKSEAEGFGGTWGTPVVTTAGDITDIVLSVPGEIWGINPENGKLRWFSEGLRGDSACNSVVGAPGIVYAMGERGSGSIALRTGGKGDVSQTHVDWSGSNGPRIPTPLLWDGRLYWINGSLANCRDAKTGREIYAERIPGASSGSADSPRDRDNRGPDNREFAGGGGGFGGGRRGGGMGGGMGGDYSSPVAASGQLYQVTRRGETIVIRLGPAFAFTARNRFASDTSDFSATPAISDGQLFLRSAQKPLLYRAVAFEREQEQRTEHHALTGRHPSGRPRISQGRDCGHSALFQGASGKVTRASSLQWFCHLIPS